MYGEKATELIRSLTREETKIIPHYQYELIEAIMRENDELYAENLKTSQSVPEQNSSDGKEEIPSVKPAATSTNGQADAGHDATGGEQKMNTSQEEAEIEPNHPDGVDIGEKEIMVMQVRHTAKLWNKRCILAYHYERLNRLKRLRWEIGNNLPKEIVNSLSKKELEWFTKYNQNLFSYMNSLNGGDGLDLTLYTTPPRRLYIQVRCVRDYGQIDLENGQPVMLKKDSIHYLPLSQCEKLIHQGILEQLC